MLFNIQKNIKYILGLFSGLLLIALQPAWAAGPPAPSAFSNPMVIVMIILMVLLLIIIGILANILVGAADIKLKKKKAGQNTSGIASALLIILLLSGANLFAQDATTPPAAKSIAGMSTTTFYIMVAVLFIELLIIIGLLINIKFLLKSEKEKVVSTVSPEKVKEAKKSQLTWWDRFNKLKPVSEEADLDLGHEYDGIRELNNRLPPWWLYGFYLTILFAAVYLWRFHVSHTGPTSKEEYERSVAKAELRVQEYLKLKGENVNENTVTYLNNPADLEAGKAIFLRPGFCNTCHGADGSGLVGGNPGVGPNLTDEYWITNGSIKTIFSTIKYGGRPNKGMQSWESQLSGKQMAQLASFIKSLAASKPAKGKDPEPEAKPYKEEAPAPQPADSTMKDNKVTMK
jgi:cytochrome c oxidase cbb3-type subunit III